VDVNLGRRVVGQIAVHRGCNPFSVASRFVRERRLPHDVSIRLATVVEERLAAFLRDEESRNAAERRRRAKRSAEQRGRRATATVPFKFAASRAARGRATGGGQAADRAAAKAAPHGGGRGRVVGRLRVRVRAGGGGKTQVLVVRLGDDPSGVVSAFQREHGLGDDEAGPLVEAVARRLKQAEEDRAREEEEEAAAARPAVEWARFDDEEEPAVGGGLEGRGDGGGKGGAPSAAGSVRSGFGGGRGDAGAGGMGGEGQVRGRSLGGSPSAGRGTRRRSVTRAVPGAVALRAKSPAARRQSVSDARRHLGWSRDDEVTIDQAAGVMLSPPRGSAAPSELGRRVLERKEEERRRATPDHGASPAGSVTGRGTRHEDDSGSNEDDSGSDDDDSGSDDEDDDDDDGDEAMSPGAAARLSARQQALLQQTLAAAAATKASPGPPPRLAPAPPQRAPPPPRPVLLRVSLEFAEDEWGAVEVREGDSVWALSEAFCAEHRLGEELVAEVHAVVMQRVEEQAGGEG